MKCTEDKNQKSSRLVCVLCAAMTVMLLTGCSQFGAQRVSLDEAEPEVHPQQYSNLKLYAGNGAQTAMLYPYYYSKMFYEGLKAEGEEDIILLTSE